MTAPIVIQHPGAGQFLQSGLEQGIGLGQKQQELGIQKETAEAGIAAKKQELALQERTVAANEAFRRGYGSYLENRGRYYGAKAEETTAQRQRTEQYVNSLTDPEAKQNALLALSDPNLQRAMTAQAGQVIHQRTLAGNLLLHGGPSMTLAQAYRIADLPTKPGDEKIHGAPTSMYDRATQSRMSALGANMARLSVTLHQAEEEQKSYRDFLSGQATLHGQNLTPEQLDSSAAAHVSKKYGNLDQLRTQLIQGQAELTGILAPHLGQGQGMPNAPAVPDLTGGGSTSTDPSGNDMQIIDQVSKMIDQMNDLYDNQQDAAAFSAGSGGSF